MIRSKGEAGTGNIVEAVRHLRSIIGDIRKITQADSAELFDWAKRLQAPLPLVQEVAETGWLPVPLFCAGGIATPADAALVMQLGAEAVFVGSGIFKSDDPAPRAKAIVEATTHFRDADILAKVSRGLGDADDRHRHGRARRHAGRPGLVAGRDLRPREAPRCGPRIGVLALQGAFAAHARVLAELGADPVEVRTPARSRRRRRAGHARRRVDDDVAAARVVRPVRPDRRAPGRRHAGPRHVRRHDPARRPRCSTAAPTSAASAPSTSPCAATRYGRQVDSFETDLDVAGLGDAPFHAVFIRAPLVERVGPDVEVLAEPRRPAPVLARQGPSPWPSFHPELSGDRRLHAPLPRRRSRSRCPVIPSGRRSSTRRGPRTRPGASCSPSSSARSRWRPARAAATSTANATLRTMFAEGPRRVGAHRHHRAGHQAGHRRARRRHLRVDHLRGLRARRRGRAHRRAHRQPQPHRRRGPQPVLQAWAARWPSPARCRGSSAARASILGAPLGRARTT